MIDGGACMVPGIDIVIGGWLKEALSALLLSHEISSTSPKHTNLQNGYPWYVVQ